VHGLITYVNNHAPVENVLGNTEIRKDYKLGNGYTQVPSIELGYL
jgi:hypothetical protein